jgi:hypothetical protein
MNLEELLHDSGNHWRAAQPPVPDYNLPGLLTRRQAGWRPPRWTPAAASVAVVALVAAIFFFHQAVAPSGPAPSPGSSASNSGTLSSNQLTGTWYSTVSVTQARRQHHNLVGDWVLVLDPNGSARLSQVGGAIDVVGRWRLTGTQVQTRLAFPGCSSADGAYTPALSTLHPGLLELVDVPNRESCVPRAVVLDGHWFTTPSSP